MDNIQFGIFLAALRKEKGWTQQELAARLNVTDKAVSKWERGAGFPDIKTLEPLADALGVSLLELMRSQRIPGEQIPADHADEAISCVIDAAKLQSQLERRNLLICVITAMTAVMLVLLIDTMGMIGFSFVCLPLIFLAAGIILMVYSWVRRKKQRPFKLLLVLGLCALAVPGAVFVFLLLAFTIGGPVPT
ncbi:MAG: helix-turn-helix transcriptional regulator [Eubacteriales bacterium]|nr:helix-turn-helix transcriptional regulator [Eubacteriales bacterium]